MPIVISRPSTRGKEAIAGKPSSIASEVFRLTRAMAAAPSGADSKREKLFDLPEIPKREERLAILLKERPDPKPAEETKSGKTFVLVSGLPRSGTSLMMQFSKPAVCR